MSAESNRAARDLVMGMVVAAMQEAEERGGPEGAEYVALMREIASEAARRAGATIIRPRYFQIAELIGPVLGTDLGGTWNGWRRPRFRRASAEAIMAAHNEEHGTFSGVNADQTAAEERPCAWYEPETRRFWFYQPDSDDTDCFDPVVVDGVDHWDIGTDGWTWEEAPVTRITLTFEIVGGPPVNVQDHVDSLLDEGEIQEALDPDGEWEFLQSDATTEAL